MDATAGAALGGVIGFFLLAVVGLVVGAVAKLLMPGTDPGGWFVTILLGIAGSWVGGFVFKSLGIGGAEMGTIGAFITAVLGAMLLLFVYRLIKRRR